MLALDASSSVDGQPLRNLKRAGSAVIGCWDQAIVARC